jgi:hypothetical protein
MIFDLSTIYILIYIEVQISHLDISREYERAMFEKLNAIQRSIQN